MKLHLWGTDFRRSSAETRAKLFVAEEKRADLVRHLLALGFDDLVYLATCNRIEFYTTAPNVFADTRNLWVAALQHMGLESDAYYQGYHFEGKTALRHLMRVASSLESLVVGEPQILGQLKDAVRWTKTQGLPIDGSLEKSFVLAFETAKKVRTNTPLAEKPVSVASLGLRHLESLESQFPLQRAVIVGRSPIALSVLDWLSKNRPDCSVLWVNRNLEKLDAHPQSAGTEKMALGEFLETPPSFTHLFTATSSPMPVFDTSFFDKLPKPAPQLFFDFAQPPDVCREVCLGENRELVRLENLMAEAQENAKARAVAIRESELIIEDALRGFCLDQKEAPLIRDFGSVEPLFVQDLNTALQALMTEVPETLHAKIRRWAEKLVHKNLHHSREHLRSVIRRGLATDHDDSLSAL